VSTRPTIVRTIGLLVLAAALLVGCTHSGSRATTATAPTAAPTSAVARDLDGAHVGVLGLWSGPELESFLTVKAAWERETGGTVDWEGTDDLPDRPDDRMAAGTPPEIAILPNLAMMRRLAGAGELVPLDTILETDQVARDYAPAWIDLGSDGGKLYGIVYKVANKATVWYSPGAFAAAGYRVPTTWGQMTTLAEQMVADGRTPFSIVAARGLRAAGP